MNNQAERDNMKKPLASMDPLPQIEKNPSIDKHERKPSIDAEPKTLLREELNVAREAALKIINTHSKEEALKIFLTGLVPVASSTQAKEDAVDSDYYDDDDDDE